MLEPRGADSSTSLEPAADVSAREIREARNALLQGRIGDAIDIVDRARHSDGHDEEARAQSPVLFEQRGNDKWHVRVPGGENYAEVAARISDWVRELETDTIAISHGATTRILRGLLAGLDWREMSSLDEPQGVVFRVSGSQVTRLDP